MQIQQSHFFTVDLFVNTFALLALLFAVAILEHKEKKVENWEELQPVVEELSGETSESSTKPFPLYSQFGTLRPLITSPLLFFSIAFGLALGMAMALQDQYRTSGDCSSGCLWAALFDPKKGKWPTTA